MALRVLVQSAVRDTTTRALGSSSFTTCSLALVLAGLLASAPQTRAQAPAEAADEASADAPADNEETADLDKVVVRARNRLEPLKDVPLSISVVTGRELERLQATDVKEVLQRAGNVSWNQGNQRTSSLAIRGIGKIGQTEAQDPSVGVIVDGVNYAYNALTSSYDFTDVDTVEVTRGPQGTLLGKNTSVGVVSINTRRPSFTPDALYSVTFGENNTLQASAAGGGAVVDDKIAWRGALSVSKGWGDVVNAYNRDLTYTNLDRASGRVQLLFTPTSDLSVRVAAEITPRAGEFTNGRTINTPTPAVYSNGSANSSLTNEKRLARDWFAQQSSYTVEGDYLYGGGENEVNNNSARPLVTGNNGGTVDANWNVGNFNFVSISAYKDYHFNAVNDEGTPFDVYRNSGGFWNDYKQWSQELRLSSQLGSLVDYQTGLYYMQIKNDAEYQRVWGNDAGAWLATNAQYNTLYADGNGRYLLRNSLAGLSMAYNSPAGLQQIDNESAAIFAQANWHLSEPLTLTTGVRLTREDRRNTGSSYINDNGVAPELNPATVNGIGLGGFTSDSSGNLADGNTAVQLALANQLAVKYFGIADYNSLTAAQKAQVAAAKAIRQTAIGVVFNETAAAAFEETQKSFVVSPAYKLNDNITTFVSWQYGEKPGIAQLTNGISNLVKAETTNDFELGFKTVLLDKKLTFNATAFLMNIRDYQQAVRVVDEYTTELNRQADPSNYEIAYVSATGNVPKVQSKGVELDGVFVGIPNTALRWAAAYNDARYKEFKNSAQPNENGYSGAAAYRDVSGQALAGAPKWSGNLGVDYRIPIFAGLEAHSSANVVYTGRYNSDVSLSSYAWIPSSLVGDVSLGVGRRDQKFDFSVIVKNVADDDTPVSQSWNGYSPAKPRTFYLQFRGRI